VRVVRRIAELDGDQLLELLGEDVLEHLRLVVDAIPRHAEVLRQVELEQPVVADHLERDARALRRELDALVGLVRDEVELAELADHARRRGGGDAHALGDRGRGDGAGAERLEGVDGLRVVLDGGRDLWVTHRHDSHYGTPKS
jgi:hypothetical protein